MNFPHGMNLRKTLKKNQSDTDYCHVNNISNKVNDSCHGFTVTK